MQQLLSLRSRRPVRTLMLAATLMAAAFMLGACGYTDAAGTNYKIVIVSELEDSLAPLGILKYGEVGRVTFEVTRSGHAAIDRTANTQFELRNDDPEDDASAFNFVESSDLSLQPYHTVTSFVYDVQVNLCAVYNGPEVLDGPVETCMLLLTQEEADR